ncbi:hypothetical protein K474DRAFT_1154902 [Panus rudis PR-1116 ss-1]|nr:hypothetical protein K474DRAFT_1154902 [Panus rudis PR-1116 ss-1]
MQLLVPVNLRSIINIPDNGLHQSSSSAIDPTLCDEGDIVTAEHAEAEDRGPPFSRNIARFAFVPSSRQPSIRSMSRGASVARSESVPSLEIASRQFQTKAGKSNGAALASSHRFTDFPDEDLARLRKCVSCDQAWTARKSVVQKMKHVQTCGKKKKLTEDIIRVLLAKELNLDPTDPSRKGQKSPPTTLLEDVVNGEAPRKKGRKAKAAPAVVETVRNLADTRSDILARARLLLDGADTLKETCRSNSKTPESVEFQRDELIPPSTQPFGESALARKFQSIPLHLQQAEVSHTYDPTPSFPVFPHSTENDGDDEELLETQPFGISRLAQKYQSRVSVDVFDEMMPTQHYLPPSSFPVSGDAYVDGSNEERQVECELRNRTPREESGGNREDFLGSPLAAPGSSSSRIPRKRTSTMDPFETPSPRKRLVIHSPFHPASVFNRRADDSSRCVA